MSRYFALPLLRRLGARHLVPSARSLMKFLELHGFPKFTPIHSPEQRMSIHQTILNSRPKSNAPPHSKLPMPGGPPPIGLLPAVAFMHWPPPRSQRSCLAHNTCSKRRLPSLAA